MPNSYTETKLAFISLETLVPPEKLPFDNSLPAGIHPQAKDAIHSLQAAGYPIIFLYPRPLNEYNQAIAWLKSHNLREYQEAEHTETRALYGMSELLETNTTFSANVSRWMAGTIQQLLVDRQGVTQVIVLDSDANQVRGNIFDAEVPCLSVRHLEILPFANVADLLQDPRVQGYFITG